MEHRLYSIHEVIALIEKGYHLSLAADERVLSKLPKGNWIAGTIPYFMDVNSGLFTQELIYVNKLTDLSKDVKIKVYDIHNIDILTQDTYHNGFTLLIIPPFQEIHQDFAIKSETMEGLYDNPVVGWVAGIDLSSGDVPKVYNGLTLESYENKVVAFHVQLPENTFAQIDIINIFKQDPESPEIHFYLDSFEVIHCLIDNKEVNLSDYIIQNKIDPKLPLIADYSGASINVSIKEVDKDFGIVNFYAPVFASKTYKFAKQIDNYIKEFEINTLNIHKNNEFSCNCILNYMYGNLEGKKIENVTGPITFGEIAYQLLN